jgi:putative hydrolase of the HAD superfamily
MPREPKAVIFDLDDTLYPVRRFVHSGFAAVAGHLEDMWRVDRREALGVLARASRGESHGRELQACVAHFGLSLTILPALVQVIRSHAPALRLPRTSMFALRALRPNWHLAVVTNGLPDLQARKVDALGLRDLVDAVVYANAVGSGAGKPEREPFLVAARRLGVAPDRAIVVGDDARCDIFGAGQVGMKTVHVTRHSRTHVPACGADSTITTLAVLPAVAERLVADIRWRSHVA